MRNIRLTVCYDGTRYKGWQRLPGVENTIQGKLEQVLSRILGEDIEISGSGRTDAGAHAVGQVANFHCGSNMPCGEILLQLRRYLPEDIGIVSCEEAAPRFHARLNCRTKTYQYRVWNSENPCVFDRRFVYVLADSLDIERMQYAAKRLIGEHDFSAFCANKKMKKSTVRRVDAIDIRRSGEEILFTFTGDGFLYNMARAMAGTVVYAAEGKFPPEQIGQILDSGNRTAAGPTVPPGGLYMTHLWYDDGVENFECTPVL